MAKKNPWMRADFDEEGRSSGVHRRMNGRVDKPRFSMIGAALNISASGKIKEWKVSGR